MTDDGADLLANLRETRRILTDVSLLLRTADGLMKKAGWESLTSTSRETAYDIKAPERWSPWTIFRFYKNPSHPLFVPFIAALLNDHPNDEYALRIPLVSAGYFRLNSEAAVTNIQYNYWYSQLYAYVSPTKDGDGSIIQQQGNDWQKKLGYVDAIESAACFAWPLVTFREPTDIESKLTARVLHLVETQSLTSPSP